MSKKWIKYKHTFYYFLVNKKYKKYPEIYISLDTCQSGQKANLIGPVKYLWNCIRPINKSILTESGNLFCLLYIVIIYCKRIWATKFIGCMNERMKLRSLQTFNQFKLDLETTQLTLHCKQSPVVLDNLTDDRIYLIRSLKIHKMTQNIMFN